MAIIPVVGRKSPRMRFIIAMLYTILTLGAVTTVYPFLLMLGSSVTSNVDLNEYRPLPRYLVDDGALFRKYSEDKYYGNLDVLNGAYRSEFAKLENITAPTALPEKSPGLKRMVEDWQAFAKTLPVTDKDVGFRGFQGSPSELMDRYRAFLQKRFHSNIEALNRSYTEENQTFQTVMIPFERQTRPEWFPDMTSPKMREWYEFKRTLPEQMMLVVGAEPLWSTFLKEDQYDGDIAKLNAAYHTSYKSFGEVTLPSTQPTASPMKEDWEIFVRTQLPFRYMLIGEAGQNAYIAMLKAKYGDIARLNSAYETSYTSFASISIPTELPSGGPMLLDYMDFITKSVPMASITVDSPENRFRTFLMWKYGSIADVNRAYQTKYAHIMAVQPPIAESDWMTMVTHAKQIREHFLTRNYGMVVSYIVTHGHAVLNTLILCFAAVLTHLIVNPLCAYALSRFNLSYSYRVLLFLLATMAFPAEVAMIPNFLLLKQFHMLNTYWALILPGMASGYSIFLLKGFFDSLPKELYEAGTLDGASEMRMFFRITIPLSKPIFAVIALQSFTAAYASWLYALVVCQDQRMWTLMVWLYEMQTWAPKSVILAALSLTALPSLLIFACCQNVIMRGIILPTEH